MSDYIENCEAALTFLALIVLRCTGCAIRDERLSGIVGVNPNIGKLIERFLLEIQLTRSDLGDNFWRLCS